jgi:hypothetical protein
MGKRLAYTLLGIGIGLTIAWGIQSAIGKRIEIGGISTVIGVACGALAVSIAERKGKVKSIEELKRPATLFPK